MGGFDTDTTVIRVSAKRAVALRAAAERVGSYVDAHGIDALWINALAGKEEEVDITNLQENDPEAAQWLYRSYLFFQMTTIRRGCLILMKKLMHDDQRFHSIGCRPSRITLLRRIVRKRWPPNSAGRSYQDLLPRLRCGAEIRVIDDNDCDITDQVVSDGAFQAVDTELAHPLKVVDQLNPWVAFQTCPFKGRCTDESGRLLAIITPIPLGVVGMLCVTDCLSLARAAKACHFIEHELVASESCAMKSRWPGRITFDLRDHVMERKRTLIRGIVAVGDKDVKNDEDSVACASEHIPKGEIVRDTETTLSSLMNRMNGAQGWVRLRGGDSGRYCSGMDWTPSFVTFSELPANSVARFLHVLQAEVQRLNSIIAKGGRVGPVWFTDIENLRRVCEAAISKGQGLFAVHAGC